MEGRKFWNYENKLLTILFFTVGFVFFDRLAINFLIPFIQSDIQLTNMQIGLLSAALGCTWAISGYLLSFISDKVGKKKNILLAAVILFSASSFFSGMVSTFAGLIAFRMIMGLAEGPVLPISQSLLALESSESRRGFNMGLMQSSAAGLMGSVLAPLLIVGLAETYGWRISFYVTIIPGLIVAFFIWKLVKDPQTVAIKNNELEKGYDKVRFSDVLKTRNILLTVLLSCFFIAWYIVLITFAPMFLINVKHLSPGDMSLILSAFGLGGVIFGFTIPAISDRIGRKPIIIIFSIISALAPLALIYVNSTSVAVFSLIMFVCNVGQGVIPLLLSTIPAESISPKYITAAIGLTIGVGEIFGGVVAPLIAGMMADKYGLSAPIFISVGSAAVAVIISLFLVETAPKIIKRKRNSNNLEGIAQ